MSSYFDSKLQSFGSKLYDRTKTGQFGVGFNAVYHLTDVPSFITRGPDISSGGTFCVFDPHCWHVPIATTDSPGTKDCFSFVLSF
jgi:sacsin